MAVLATCGYFLLPSTAARDAYFSGFALAASGLVLVGIRRNAPARRSPWYLLAAGLLTYALGEVTWSVYEIALHTRGPFPSLADVFWLAGYAFTAAALLSFIRSRQGPGRDRGALADAAILSISLGLVSWIFLMAPYVVEPGLRLPERTASLAYPTMDVLVLAIALRLLLAPGARTSSYRFLVAGLASYLAADVGYAIFVLRGTYHTGMFVDAGWLAGGACLAVAALHPSMARMSDPVPDTGVKLTARRVAVLVGAALLPPVILAARPAGGGGLVLVTVVIGSVGLWGLVVGRLWGLVRAVETSTSLLQEQREATAAEQRVVAELRRVNQLRNDIVAIASHELRAPLTSIIGYAKTLQRPEFASDAASREEFLATIARQGDRLKRLVDNLLAASRLENGELRPVMGEVGLRPLFDELLEALGPRAERVVVDVPPDLPVLVADRHLLERSIGNLLDNALKYSPETKACELGARMDGCTMLIWVSDGGIGIREDELDRIFDRFYQVDRSSIRSDSGIGLGLSLVRDMVEAMGGTIDVVSKLGYGSRFTLHLPVHGTREDAVVVAAYARNHSSAAGSRPTAPTREPAR